MKYVLVGSGPGRVTACRVVAEKVEVRGKSKNVRVYTCRKAQDHGARYVETRTFEVTPVMILAEWEDEYETNVDHLNYAVAVKNLAREWTAKPGGEWAKDI